MEGNGRNRVCLGRENVEESMDEIGKGGEDGRE